jgi:site-specific DNA-methyltransferase (adenine-specific)
MIVEQMLKNAPKPLLHIADVSGSALFQGDCLEIMPLMPDKSVQLILADLPYGTTQCKWDSVIDLDLLWKQYKRIIKDNGAIVLTASQPFTTKLINSNLEWFKYEWIWVKNRVTNIFNAKKQPMKAHENICVFYKKQSIYNPIFEDRLFNSHNRKNTKTRNTTQIYGNSQMIIKELDDKSYPKSVQFINSVHPHSKEYLGHGTQKPLELMIYLISTYSNENDMVLDNTMGSGTTCLAAKELNRKFIGIEKEPKYYEIACQRCGF